VCHLRFRSVLRRHLVDPHLEWLSSNKFHAHDHEQILIVTAGRGIVATEQEERVVKTGDVVLIPAGEKHWHGATEDSEFSHIYITNRESKLTQLED